MSGNRDKTSYRFDLLIPQFLELMAKAMGEGHEKYDDDRPYPNWQYGLAEDKSPLNHAYAHLIAYHRMLNTMEFVDKPDECEEHLAHLACNAMMEYWLFVNGCREADGPEPKDFLGFVEHDQPTAADIEEDSELLTATAPPPFFYNKPILDKLLEKFRMPEKVSE